MVQLVECFPGMPETLGWNSGHDINLLCWYASVIPVWEGRVVQDRPQLYKFEDLDLGPSLGSTDPTRRAESWEVISGRLQKTL